MPILQVPPIVQHTASVPATGGCGIIQHVACVHQFIPSHVRCLVPNICSLLSFTRLPAAHIPFVLYVIFDPLKVTAGLGTVPHIPLILFDVNEQG